MILDRIRNFNGVIVLRKDGIREVRISRVGKRVIISEFYGTGKYGYNLSFKIEYNKLRAYYRYNKEGGCSSNGLIKNSELKNIIFHNGIIIRGNNFDEERPIA